MSRLLLPLLLLPMLLSAPFAPAEAAGTIRVAFAGSMGTVMDHDLGPAFARENGVAFQGIGQGSYALAQLIAAHALTADVFVAVTPGPVEVLIGKGLVREAVPVASTAMVIAFSPKSRFAARFRKDPWWQVLESPGLRFGRTDPTTDPQGRNIIFTMLLAERYYHRPNLAARILGPDLNPSQIFTEPSILSRLEAGQLDASSAYASAATSRHLPFVRLPDEISLGNPAMDKAWYARVTLSLPGAEGRPRVVHVEPLVFYAAALADAPAPQLAAKFVRFLQSPAGQQAFRSAGYGEPKAGALR